MHLYQTPEGALLAKEKLYFLLDGRWDELINQSNLRQHLLAKASGAKKIDEIEAHALMARARAPIGTQEVWAAGVTYLRSRDARMEESKESGAADVYDKVYQAERPELFFKALPQRVAGPGEPIFIRTDSQWNVPEPELTLFINSSGSIEAYTIGNDVSSRSIEGENPLYLPQAKTYERSCALGPCLWVPATPISPDAAIRIDIIRQAQLVFGGNVLLHRMKRSLPELAAWLFRACRFPSGCFLMTGTGIVPPHDFTLQPGDSVEISIEGIGTLANRTELWH
jgi:2-dehydro-3-deoxy-D-arabinonate dehydratase